MKIGDIIIWILWAIVIILLLTIVLTKGTG